MMEDDDGFCLRDVCTVHMRTNLTTLSPIDLTPLYCSRWLERIIHTTVSLKLVELGDGLVEGNKTGRHGTGR